MEVRNMNIDDIKPYDNNPRDNDNAVESTANSIKEFGWRQPIVVDKDKVIVAGHTRYYAAKKLGYDVVPVVDASDLSDEQVRAYRLADNKTGELADWNTKLLDDELQSILDIDMTDFGFDENIEFAPADEVEVKIDEPTEIEHKEVTCPHCGEVFKID
ncbi:ParB N-terminal domain-containing protein [Ligilactobacillus salivarius]|uniref:ParB N-terminal domain-containing protein n=1 Tax=Ligilactobacillus salivarius TaxID=1624 RepID=UPI003F1F379A